MVFVGPAALDVDDAVALLLVVAPTSAVRDWLLVRVICELPLDAVDEPDAVELSPEIATRLELLLVLWPSYVRYVYCEPVKAEVGTLLSVDNVRESVPAVLVSCDLAPIAAKQSSHSDVGSILVAVVESVLPLSGYSRVIASKKLTTPALSGDKQRNTYTRDGNSGTRLSLRSSPPCHLRREAQQDLQAQISQAIKDDVFGGKIGASAATTGRASTHCTIRPGMPEDLARRMKCSCRCLAHMAKRWEFLCKRDDTCNAQFVIHADQNSDLGCLCAEGSSLRGSTPTLSSALAAHA